MVDSKENDKFDLRVKGLIRQLASAVPQTGLRDIFGWDSVVRFIFLVNKTATSNICLIM